MLAVTSYRRISRRRCGSGWPRPLGLLEVRRRLRSYASAERREASSAELSAEPAPDAVGEAGASTLRGGRAVGFPGQAYMQTGMRVCRLLMEAHARSKTKFMASSVGTTRRR